jgi:hypothetical protein
MTHDPRRARCYDDPTWVYTRSESTNLRALFERVKAQQKLAAEPVKAAPNVCQIKKASAK